MMRVRKLLGWQSTEHDQRVRCGTVLLADLYCGEIVLFASSMLAGLMLPTSSFLPTWLDNYGLQLHHLTPHAIALVAIFTHFYKMYVGVRLSVRLFRIFFTLWASGRSQPLLRADYFQSRSKPSTPYIAPLSLGKWDCWREDCVIVHDIFHDQLELPTGAPIGKHDLREKDHDMQCTYDLMLKMIKFLAGKGLMSMMILFDFLSQCIAPLQQRAHTAWLHIGENGTTLLEHNCSTNLDHKVLEAMLMNLSFDPNSNEFVNLPSPPPPDLQGNFPGWRHVPGRADPWHGCR
jgi:hypothetical protein